MTKKKCLKIIGITAVLIVAVFVCLSLLGTVVYAAGLVDDTVDAGNAFSKYPLSNYQLDFYVENSWGWLPWNWSDGIGKSVMYGLYAITNFIWTVSLYISNATGYIVQEAYRLDFISNTAQAVGKNIQTLAGVSPSGFSTEGFYPGFLLILILVVGCYVAYTGLIKRETTKAIRAATNFVVVFILSAAFIAYAPSYIAKINDFSADISNAALSLGTKIVLPDSDSSGKNSVDLIRDNLHAIQIQQPWLLLQYGSTDIEDIGVERVEELLSSSPDDDNGKDREKIVKKEIEDNENANMTITKTMNRLGTVVFLLIFNIGISIFVFLLTGIMIFSQILFIVYSMFLPISFLLSMIPNHEASGKRAITKLFNTIMGRAGITLIITVAFSISTMFYSLSAGYPFFLIAFLQIVTFCGIYLKLGDLMGMFSLQSNDSQQLARGIFRRPYVMMRRSGRRMKGGFGRNKTSGTDRGSGTSDTKDPKPQRNSNDAKAGGKKADRRNKATESAGGKKSTDHNRGNANVENKNRAPDKSVRVRQQGADVKYQADITTRNNLKANSKTTERKAAPTVSQAKFKGNFVKQPNQSTDGKPVDKNRSNKPVMQKPVHKNRSNNHPVKPNRYNRGLVPEERKQREPLLNGKPLSEVGKYSQRDVKQHTNAVELAAKRKRGQVLLNGRPLVKEETKKRTREKKRINL